MKSRKEREAMRVKLAADVAAWQEKNGEIPLVGSEANSGQTMTGVRNKRTGGRGIALLGSKNG